MATAPTLYWYQLDTGTLAPVYYGQLDATVRELCTENAVTLPTAPWHNQISCSLVSVWLRQIDTAVRALCPILSVSPPATTLPNLNVGQFEATYWRQLDTCVRGLVTPTENTVAPAVTPDPADAGDLLTTTNGTWVGGPNPVYTYQWWLDGAAVPGATASTYQTVTPDDDGLEVYCVVTNTNDTGQASADSNTLTLQGSGYHADAVHFDGGAYLSIASLTAPNSPDFSLSFWFKPADEEVTPWDTAILWASDVAGNYLNYLSIGANGGVVSQNFSFGDATALLFLFIEPVVDPTEAAWHNILLSINTNHGVGAKIVSLWLDDVDITAGITDSSIAFDIALNALSFFVFSDGTDGFVGDMADFWCAPGQTLLTGSTIVEATRRKFIDAGGKPVDLGSDGSTPTGTVPRIFFSGDSTGFATNKGTGGTFTLTGSLTNASTSPSD